MPSRVPIRRLSAATATALATSLPVQGVTIGPDGLGQALIYPYYTVRAATGGNAFNTYLTVVNTTIDAKAVRVRVREGRIARPVLDFNLYLSPNDVWAAAIVPTEAGAQLVTVDTTCTDPAFVATGSGSAMALPLNANAYTGSNADGYGDTLDRTREGYVEMIEMATLSGQANAAVSHNSAGVPNNCAGMRAMTAPAVGRPRGGLSGTLTLINVNSGQDFTLDATPLDALATLPFFRPPGDPYPDWNAAEIDPVSVRIAYGHLYRSTWTRPVDAVTAVLMRSQWQGEYIMDNATGSLTDLVVTMPTRQYHTDATSSSPPFSAPLAWGSRCGATTSFGGENLGSGFFNREEQGAVVSGVDLGQLTGATRWCASAGVASIRNNAIHLPQDPTRSTVFGSTSAPFAGSPNLHINTGFQNGWIWMRPEPGFPVRPPMTSQPGSTRTNLATGQVTAGSHTFRGLPMVGFTARTFANGTLRCGAGSCQGNYGGAFPFRYAEPLDPPP